MVVIAVGDALRGELTTALHADPGRVSVVAQPSLFSALTAARGLHNVVVVAELADVASEPTLVCSSGVAVVARAGDASDPVVEEMLADGICDVVLASAGSAELRARVRGHALRAGRIPALLRAKRCGAHTCREDLMGVVGRFAGGVANDLNNVLAAILGFAASLHEDLPEGTTAYRDADAIIEACWRGQDLANDLAHIAGRERRSGVTSLNDAVSEIAVLLGRARTGGCEIRTRLDPGGARVRAGASSVKPIVANLALNAVAATRPGGVVLFATEERELTAAERAAHQGLGPADRYVVLEVSDDGDGLPPQQLTHAFEPFFAHEGNRERSGLGLAVVYGAARGLGASVVLASEPGRGTTAQVVFPASDATTTVSVPAGPRRGGTVRSAELLVIDNEEIVLAACARMLGRLGYTVTTATSADEALALFAAAPDRFALVMLDVIIPGSVGTDVLGALQRIAPGVRVLIFSGDSHREDVASMLAAGAAGFLKKPFRLRALADAVAGALA